MAQKIELSTSQRARTKDHIDPAHTLLEANRSEIESIQRRTFAYGVEETHKLDVYYPSCNPDDKLDLPPILVFFYGGSLVRDTRTDSLGLFHNNLGAYFASRGILTVIPDYRLVPGITFPQGAEDIRDALKWVIGNIVEADVNRIYVLAHSAGGIPVASCTFTPGIWRPLARHIQGVVFIGVPFRISPERAELYSNALAYYGSSKEVSESEPIALLQSFSDGARETGSLPPILNLRAASEPKQISRAIQEFTKTLKDKGGEVQECVLAGHDHLSPIMALSSSYGEEWGEKVAEWIFEGRQRSRADITPQPAHS